jgi:hypothetical protein
MTQNVSFYWKPANKQKNNNNKQQYTKQKTAHGLKLRETLCFSLTAAAC